MRAERGKENSRIPDHRGLRYRILNADGSSLGLAVKADTLPGEPAVAALEKFFKANKAWRSRLKQPLQQRVDAVLSRSPADMDTFKELLSRENVFLILRTNADGRHCGITYIDMLNRWVCNGSDLGTKYSLTPLHKIGLVTAAERKRPGVEARSPFPLSHGSRKSNPRVVTDKLNQSSAAEPLQEVIPRVPSRETAPASRLQKKGTCKKKRTHS